MTMITSKPFGYTKSGHLVTAFEMRNSQGVTVRVLDLGCAIQSILLLDREGKETDVVLGYEDVASYEEGSCFYGAVVGRYANRIKGGHFFLEGKEYQLEKNSPNGTNHIHGVFAQKVFESKIEGEELVFHYLSPDGEEGYPGNLSLTVTYTLSEDGALTLEYEATTDETTVINLTNHCYFNLNGHDGSTVLGHHVWLNCIAYTEYSDTFAPTGRIIPVEGTPLDFRNEHQMERDWDSSYRQFRICTGFDHNMILDGKPGELKPVGTAYSEQSGICLRVFTTEPAIQFYSGNFIQFDNAPMGKYGIRYPKNGGLCMEAQHYPDSVNNPSFPSTVLHPGETYHQKTIYQLSCPKKQNAN